MKTKTNAEDVLSNAPAGESTRDARVVAMARASLRSRIGHGVRLIELRASFNDALAAEEALLN